MQEPWRDTAEGASPKQFQNRRVSSAAAEHTVVPSGLCKQTTKPQTGRQERVPMSRKNANLEHTPQGLKCKCAFSGALSASPIICPAVSIGRAQGSKEMPHERLKLASASKDCRGCQISRQDGRSWRGVGSLPEPDAAHGRCGR